MSGDLAIDDQPFIVSHYLRFGAKVAEDKRVADTYGRGITTPNLGGKMRKWLDINCNTEVVICPGNDREERTLCANLERLAYASFSLR